MGKATNNPVAKKRESEMRTVKYPQWNHIGRTRDTLGSNDSIQDKNEESDLKSSEQRGFKKSTMKKGSLPVN